MLSKVSAVLCPSSCRIISTVVRQGNPTTGPVLGMLILFKFEGRGAPVGVRHFICGVSEFLQVVYTKPLGIYYNFKFNFPE